MKLLVFGRTGQVARALRETCPEGWHLTALGRDEADLRDPAACADRIAGADVDAVINAAAHTDVDGAETDEQLAHTVNGAAPGAMACEAARRGLPFLHLSTDYVFDGLGDMPRRPGDATAPCNAYGRSKLAGEQAVRAAGGPHVILRTAWVFSPHGRNFVTTMLRLGRTHDRLRVVADQTGGPTAAEDIARALHRIAAASRARPVQGTWHFAGAPAVNWADFAREIFARADLPVTVEDIPASAWPTAAARPANSRLDCAATERDFGIARPDWRAALGRVLATLKEG